MQGNFPPRTPAGEQKYREERVEIDDGGGPVVLWNAADDGAPAFSGAGGTATTALYVSESFDISAFAGSTVELRFVIAAGPGLIVDLDDILIYVKLEEVTIEFGDFSVTFEAGSFVRDDDDDEGGWKLRRKKPGITKVKIGDDGEFEVRGKELDLGELDFPGDITFTLTIGDDTGSFDIPFDKKGKFEADDDEDDD